MNFKTTQIRNACISLASLSAFALSAQAHAATNNGTDTAAQSTTAAPAVLEAQSPDPDAGASHPAVTTAPELGALDATLGVKGWNIPFPSYAETIDQNQGGLRSTMAKYGFGLIGYEEPLFAVNVLNRPRSTNGQQAYWGQQASFGNVLAGYLTYDLGKVGLDGGQLSVGGVWIRSTYTDYLPNSATLYRLAYYQSLLNGRVEFATGLMDNSLTWVGTFVGGQVQSPFGPTASIPTEVGLSASSVSQPTAWIKYHPTESTYNSFGIARSIDPRGIQADLDENPSNIQFTVPNGRALFIDEVGYQTQPHAHAPSTWFRAGFIYNTSPYQVFGANRTQNNTAGYIGIDQQVLQTKADSDTQAYRGLYLGASAQVATPSVNAISQYYELRAYWEGPFDSRPADIVNFVVAHQKVSSSFAAQINATTASTGLSSNHFANSISTSYTARLFRGTYVTLGLQYQDRPSITYVSGPQSALNFLASAFIIY
jgi:porin